MADPNNPFDLVGWKLWYADGSTVTSAQSTWNDAPQHKTIALHRYWSNGAMEIVTGDDLYTRERKDALELEWPPSVKVGHQMSNDEFAALCKIIYADDERIEVII